MSEVLEFDDALAVVMRHAASVVAPEMERCALQSARGRVLAEPIHADRDQPPFDRATRDGYAVRAGELSNGAVKIIGSLRAGEAWTGGAIARCNSIEIMTGAAVPADVDAVVMLEHVTAADGRISLAQGRSVSAGENIVPRGSEAKRGDELLTEGTRLGAAEIGLAAACGAAELTIHRRPRVGIVATGDELVTLDSEPMEHQIRDSNSYTLAAMVEVAGGEAVRLPAAADTRESLHGAIESARGCDLLIFAGGVSAGRHDLVEDALAEAGAEFHFTGVRMQPGRPVVFGSLRGGPYFFGLPGNPGSAMVTFAVFARTLLRAMCGEGAQPLPLVESRLTESVRVNPGLTRFLPAVVRDAEVKVIATQGSGDMAAHARANCYVLLDAASSGAEAGESVKILLP